MNETGTYTESKFQEKFRELVEFFNKLEQDLQHPNCDGYEDQRRVLAPG